MQHHDTNRKKKQKRKEMLGEERELTEHDKKLKNQVRLTTRDWVFEGFDERFI